VGTGEQGAGVQGNTRKNATILEKIEKKNSKHIARAKRWNTEGERITSALDRGSMKYNTCKEGKQQRGT
jgi:hypothetical protein